MAKRGFTLVELMVAITLAAILVIIVYSLFLSYDQAVLSEEQRIEVAQGSRTALGKMKSDIELMGLNVAFNKGQPGLIYAAPWELVFNGDSSSYEYNLANNTDVDYGNGYTYTGHDYDSPAETVHYFTAESTSTSVGSMDFSASVRDRNLIRRVNGNSNAEGVVGYGLRVDTEGAGADAYPDGSRVAPLFAYWGDFDLDPSTPPTLWGDSTPDGVLDDDEKSALYSGSYNLSYTSAFGAVTVTGQTGGPVFLLMNGSPTNDEDFNGNGQLDYGEDFNRNGRLDHNLLDTTITRVELSVTMLIQQTDRSGAGHEHGSPYKEVTVTTASNPRNLGKSVDRDCTGAPDPPSSPSATEEDCGRGIYVSWVKSADDGEGDNDVLWYEISRSVGGGAFSFYNVVPATGVGDASCSSGDYCFLDENVTAGVAYTYQITAVDCGDNHSGPATTGSVTPTTDPLLPPSDLQVWDTGCYESVSGYGSITLRWTESTSSNVGQYWIYRSNTNQIDEMIDVPIAKLPTNHSQLNTSCAAGATSDIQAEYLCRNAQFYRWHDGSGNFVYVWRDEYDSPARSASLPPVDGDAYGMPLNGYGGTVDEETITSAMSRYQYEIRAYNNINECLSDPLQYVSSCGDYNEAQSFNPDSSSGSHGRFSPPWNLELSDASIYDITSTDPQMMVRWDASPNQFCEIGSPNPDIPDLTRYYIYRSTTYLDYDTGCRLRHALLEENASGEIYGAFKFADGPPKNAIVFKGRDVSDPTMLAWQFTDAKAILEAGDAWYINTATKNLQPDTTTAVDSANHTLKMLSDTGDLDCTGQPSRYEYMVAAVSTDEGAGGVPVLGDDWSYGASCTQTGGFDCDCTVSVLTPSSTEYCDLHGDIEVFWTWATQPAGGFSDLQLLAKNAVDPSAAWFIVDDNGPSGTLQCVGSTCSGLHHYDDQVSGTTYTYAVLARCVDADCTRIMDLNVTEDAGIPYESHVCYENQAPAGSPACPEATTNCDTGQVTIEMREWMRNCSTTVQTDEDEVWWNVKRYSTDDPNGSTYPTYPDNGTASEDVGGHHTGYWLRIGQGGAAIWSPTGYTYTQYGDSLVNVRGHENVNYSGEAERAYFFSEYLTPTKKYKYVFTLMVEHPPGGAHALPNCPPAYGGSGPVYGADQCAGGFGPAGDPYVVVVNYINRDQCYPPTTSAASPSGPPVKTAGYPFEWDDFNWVGNWELVGPGEANLSDERDMPWMGREFVFFDFSIDIDILWLHIHISFEAGSNSFVFDSGDKLRTDWNGVFGSLWDSLLSWIADVLWGLCDWCLELFQITIFCITDFWPSCYDDLIDLKLLNNVWTNFNSGICLATGSGDSQTLDGDVFFSFHTRSEDQNWRINPVTRGQYRPSSSGFVELQFELDFRNSSTMYGRVQYPYGIDQVKEWTPTGPSNPKVLSGDSEDDDWWSVMILLCTNHLPSSGNYNETYAYMWAKSDNAKTNDWYLNYYNTAPVIAWSTVGRTTSGLGSLELKGSVPTGCSTWCHNNSSTYSCNDGAPLRCVIYPDGKLGFWADPNVDFSGNDTYYDNIRIVRYCGQCPPQNQGHWSALAASPEPPQNVRVTNIRGL